MHCPEADADAGVPTAGIVGASGLTYPITSAALTSFIEELGHRFADAELLGRSLTHRSWCAEHAGFQSNERLEFLGDAVLGLVVTDEIYRRHPEAGEGQLSRIRASVVCASALAEMARELGLGEALLLGKGEDTSGGRERPSILSDAMEAVIGAVYLDGGPEAAWKLVQRLVEPRLADAVDPDHKSRLHEYIARDDRRISYDIVEDGPEHDKVFRATVLLDGEPFGHGVGRSKKLAEQAAAEAAWIRLYPDAGDSPAPSEQETNG